MARKEIIAPILDPEELIRTVRGEKVILDTDLARIYGIPTFRLNEAVKRNKDRFPPDFMFRLSLAEFEALKSQIAMSETGGPVNSSQIAMSSRKHFPRIELVNGRQLVDLLVEHWQDIPEDFKNKLGLKPGLVLV